MQQGFNISIGQPESLGEPVRSRLGQAVAIGKNERDEKELYFVSNGDPATFYVLDLLTGRRVYSYDIPGSDAVWAMDVGTDGNVYLSGTSDGKLYRYSPLLQEMEVLAASPEDFFVWDIKACSDGTIVSATYPRSKIFEYNISTSQFKDLGRMSEEEQYARGIAVTPEYIYAGLGSTVCLIRLNRKTGERKELHLEGYSGEKGFVDRIQMIQGQLLIWVNQMDLHFYDVDNERIVHTIQTAGSIALAENDPTIYYYVFESRLWKYNSQTQESEELGIMPGCYRTSKIKLMDWISVSQEEAIRMGLSTPSQENISDDQSGSRQSESKRLLVIVSCYADQWIYDPETNEMCHKVLDVPLKPLRIQTMEVDEAGMMYLGGYHRAMTVYDPGQEKIVMEFPSFAQIEGIGFLNEKVYFGTYTKAHMYVYDKTKAIVRSLDDRTPESNPRFAFPIGHQQDRPFTLTSGDGQLFVGTIPDYGLSTGALTIYDEKKDEWKVYADLVPNLSIIGLAYKDGLLYGGTSIWGGLGKQPVEEVAQIFVFDTVKRELIKRLVPEIPGIDAPPRMIGELTVGPDGNIWGAIDGCLFIMEPETCKIIRNIQVSPSRYHGKFRPVYLRWGQDGLLYTVLGRKLVIVDPVTLDYEIVDHQTLSIMTLGKDGHIYYSRGSKMYRRAITSSK